MIRQYGAQRFQPSYPMVARAVGKGKRKRTVYEPRADDFGFKHRVGTVPIGTVVYLQDGMRPLGAPFRSSPVCRNPWIVIAWLNREYAAARRGADGKWINTYMTGGHCAVVKSLRDGRVVNVADWMLQACIDAGLEKI